MVTNMSNDGVYQFCGLSSDKKPIGINCEPNKKFEMRKCVISQGSTFFEIDTKKVYILMLTKAAEGKFTAEWKQI